VGVDVCLVRVRTSNSLTGAFQSVHSVSHDTKMYVIFGNQLVPLRENIRCVSIISLYDGLSVTKL
jgi:hypothetical protein